MNRIKGCLIYSIKDKDKNSVIKLSYLFLFNLGTIWIAYGLFTRMHFGSDTYSNYYQLDTAVDLQFGRLLGYAIASFFNWIHISPAQHQAIFTSLVVIFFATLGTLLVNYIANEYFEGINLKKVILLDEAVLLCEVNVFMMEWFLYPEKIWGTILRYTFVAISVYLVSKEFQLRNIIFSFLILLMALNLYQIQIESFIIFSLLFVYLKNKGKFSRNSVVHSLAILSVGFIASVISILSLKLLQVLGMASTTSRDANFTLTSLVKNIKIILTERQLNVWLKGNGLIPYSIILLFGIAIFVILAVTLRNKKVKDILYLCSILLISYFIVFIPHVLTTTIWDAPRTLVDFFSFLAIVLIIIAYFNVSSKVSAIAIVTVSLFLLVNIFQINAIATDNFITNSLDKNYSSLIESEIENYESKNSVKVNNIAAENDISPTWAYYSEIKYSAFDINVRALAVNWARIDLINIGTGRNYKQVPMDQSVYNEHFKGKNWDKFNSKEQMVFVGDTLYMIVY